MDADEWEMRLFDPFDEGFAVLKRKYRRRDRSPLKFVECFYEFQARMRLLDRQQWSLESIKWDIAQMKASTEAMQPEFERCIPLARVQLEKKKFWDAIYEKGPPVWMGGRADGNS
jgi:hypothetical protein